MRSSRRKRGKGVRGHWTRACSKLVHVVLCMRSNRLILTTRNCPATLEEHALQRGKTVTAVANQVGRMTFHLLAVSTLHPHSYHAPGVRYSGPERCSSAVVAARVPVELLLHRWRCLFLTCSSSHRW
jgi:hypothetical protein